MDKNSGTGLFYSDSNPIGRIVRSLIGALVWLMKLFAASEPKQD